MVIQYTQSIGVSLGYRVTGEDDESIVYVPGAYSNLASRGLQFEIQLAGAG